MSVSCKHRLGILKRRRHTNSCELAANVDNHNDSHEKSADVGDAGSALEDDCVGHLDGARVTGRLYSLGSLDTITADHCAERQRRLLAYRVEISETHPPVCVCLVSLLLCVARRQGSEYLGRSL